MRERGGKEIADGRMYVSKAKAKAKKILKPRVIHVILTHMVLIVPVTGSREDKVTHWQDNREGAIHERHTNNAGAGVLGDIRLRIGVRSRVHGIEETDMDASVALTSTARMGTSTCQDRCQ